MLDILRIRLRNMIREEMSGTYGVHVSGSTYRIPRETFEVRISFGCEPTRVEELTEAIHMQIDSLKQFGPKQENIQKNSRNWSRQALSADAEKERPTGADKIERIRAKRTANLGTFLAFSPHVVGKG